MTDKSALTVEEFLAARLDTAEQFARTARLTKRLREQMLREVAAQRLILADYKAAMTPKPMSPDDPRSLAATVLQRAVCALAATHWDHPDYRKLPAGMERGPLAITCPRCGMVSYNGDDIANGYCGNCHDWTCGAVS